MLALPAAALADTAADVGGLADDVSGRRSPGDMLRPVLRGSCGRPTMFLFLVGSWFWLLFGGVGVGDFPGFSQNLKLIVAFSAGVEWGCALVNKF